MNGDREMKEGRENEDNLEMGERAGLLWERARTVVDHHLPPRTERDNSTNLSNTRMMPPLLGVTC